MLKFPSRREVTRYLDRTVRPALDEVADEFRSEGYEVEQDNVSSESGIEGPLLRVVMDTLPTFHYQVVCVETPVPRFSGRMTRDTDVYYRLEVFTQTGSGGYDLMGLTKQQVIEDVLERYEAHLAIIANSIQADNGA